MSINNSIESEYIQSNIFYQRIRAQLVAKNNQIVSKNAANALKEKICQNPENRHQIQQLEYWLEQLEKVEQEDNQNVSSQQALGQSDQIQSIELNIAQAELQALQRKLKHKKELQRKQAAETQRVLQRLAEKQDELQRLRQIKKGLQSRKQKSKQERGAEESEHQAMEIEVEPQSFAQRRDKLIKTLHQNRQLEKQCLSYVAQTQKLQRLYQRLQRQQQNLHETFNRQNGQPRTSFSNRFLQSRSQPISLGGRQQVQEFKSVQEQIDFNESRLRELSIIEEEGKGKIEQLKRLQTEEATNENAEQSLSEGGALEFEASNNFMKSVKQVVVEKRSQMEEMNRAHCRKYALASKILLKKIYKNISEVEEMNEKNQSGQNLSVDGHADNDQVSEKGDSSHMSSVSKAATRMDYKSMASKIEDFLEGLEKDSIEESEINQ